jgi:hypothetical protein
LLLFLTNIMCPLKCVCKLNVHKWINIFHGNISWNLLKVNLLKCM